MRGTTANYNFVGADGRASTTPATTAGLANDDSPMPYLDVPYSTRAPDFGWPTRQQVAQVTRTALDVLRRVADVAHPEAAGGRLLCRLR